MGEDAEISTSFEESGIASIDNVILYALSGTKCPLRFTPHSSNRTSVHVPPIECVVTLKDCPKNYETRPVQGKSYLTLYDTCVYGEPLKCTFCVSYLLLDAPPLYTDVEILGMILLVLLGIIFLLFAVICVIAMITAAVAAIQLRRKQRQYRMAHMEIPDFAGRPDVSLEQLLGDPSIQRIPFEQLEFTKRLGMGAAGVVHQARWLSSPGGARDVAIKELILSTEDFDEGTLQEFILEIKLMSALTDDNVVEFLGMSVDMATNRLYLVLELMSRGSLKDVIEQKGANLAWNMRIKLALDASKGMTYLHSRNIIHRDLKPGNLLVNQQWSCKIADFGISTISHHTTKMTCVGTPVYMAPEVLLKDKYSMKADVFSFGMVLLQLTTGRAPYNEVQCNQAQLMYRILHEGLRPDLTGSPPAMQQLIRDCWEEDLRLRPSFKEVSLRLRRMEREDHSPLQPISEDVLHENLSALSEISLSSQ